MPPVATVFIMSSTCIGVTAVFCPMAVDARSVGPHLAERLDEALRTHPGSRGPWAGRSRASASGRRPSSGFRCSAIWMVPRLDDCASTWVADKLLCRVLLGVVEDRSVDRHRRRDGELGRRSDDPRLQCG